MLKKFVTALLITILGNAIAKEESFNIEGDVFEGFHYFRTKQKKTGSIHFSGKTIGKINNRRFYVKRTVRRVRGLELRKVAFKYCYGNTCMQQSMTFKFFNPKENYIVRFSGGGEEIIPGDRKMELEYFKNLRCQDSDNGCALAKEMAFLALENDGILIKKYISKLTETAENAVTL